MSRVICPFCFKVHDFEASLECPSQKADVPARYVVDYDTVVPLWLMTIGFPRHGKTTYLAALTLLLEELSSLVEGMWYRPLDGYTFKSVRAMRDEVDLGVRKTPKGPVRPNLFHVHGIPGHASRCLVLYDIPGERYDSFEDVGRYAPAMKQVNTAWFLISLQDLRRTGERRTLTDLFNVYLSGMEKLRVDVEGWNLIVVLTKADQETLTPEIKNYLARDPFNRLMAREDEAVGDEPAGIDFERYLEEMHHISDQLETYVRRQVRGGAGFVNMVRASGMNLVFSVTSALGQSPDRSQGGLRQSAHPYRVLDPFLWALTLERPRVPRTFRLVIEPEVARGRGWDEGLLPRLWGRLADHGEVTTHLLGRSQALAGPGQRPTDPAETKPPSLIGPILEVAGPDDLLLVITSDAIVDLGDFRTSDWPQRLLLVTLGGDSPHRWPNSLAHAASGNVAGERWVEKLLTLSTGVPSP